MEWGVLSLTRLTSYSIAVTPGTVSHGMISAGKEDLLAGAFGVHPRHRYMRAIRSIWGGLACFMRERSKVPESTFAYDFEVDGLLLSNMSVKSGFALDDPEDPRYQAAEAHRARFGEVIHRATQAIAMRNTVEGEDHVDAIISVAKAAEIFLLEYGTSRAQYSTQKKVYNQLREYVTALEYTRTRKLTTGIAYTECLLSRRRGPGWRCSNGRTCTTTAECTSTGCTGNGLLSTTS